MPPVIRYAGFAEESTYAVSPSPAATYHVDIASASLDTPTESQITFPGGLGRGAVTHRPGAYAPGGDVAQGTDIRTIGWLLKWALGGYDFTAGSAGTDEAQTITVTGTPNSGTFTVKDWLGNESATIDYNDTASDIEGILEALPAIGVGNITCTGGPLPGTPVVCTFAGDLADQPVAALTVGTDSLGGGSDPEVAITESTPGVLPGWALHEIFATNENRLPSFTTRIGKDLFEHVFSGCRIDTLTIESENEFVMATPEILASKDAKDTLKAIDALLLPDAYPLAFHELTITRNVTGISCDVRSMTLTISNSLSAAHGQGSRHPCDIIAGEREVTLEMSVAFESMDHLEAYWGDTAGPSESGSTEVGWTLHLDAGADGELDIAIPRTIYTAAPVQVSGRDEIVHDLSIKAYVTTHTLADELTEVRSEMLVSLQNRVAEMVAA